MTRDKKILQEVLREGCLRFQGHESVNYAVGFFITTMLHTIESKTGDGFTIETGCEALDLAIERCTELKTALLAKRGSESSPQEST
jgi:hypothetical protein